MSIGKRIIDLARANLNALLDKAGDDTPLDQLTDEELEAELERRRDRKRRQDEERKAAERAAASARARANQQSPPPRTSGTPAPKAAATPPRTGATPPRPGTTPPRTGTAPPRHPPPRQEQRRPPPSTGLPTIAEKRLRELYAQLETPYGAPFDEVKKSFRRLMRKYHPDLHVGNPAKHKTATQLTMSLTQAYNELEQHLLRR